MEKYRVGWFAFRDFPRMGVAQIDWDTRDLKFHDLKNSAAQEPLFIPRSADAPEADWFILTVVDRFVDKTTDLLILDGNDVSRPALAIVKLPFALPMAFHGSWMPA
jgi:carotenoid cleavage dioxygenase